MTGVVDLTKLLALDDAKFIIGTSDGNIQTTITGDVVISDAGVAAIQAGVIVNTDISSTANIAITKIANGTTGQILLTNGSTNTWTTVSGDGSISPTGGLTVTNKTVTFANEGTRATTVPAFVGQIGVQIDTSIIYTANSTTEGDWIPYLQSGSLITFSGTVTSGNILTLNGTTYPIILAPGAGNIIEPVSLYAEVNYIGAAYASNTGLAVVYHGSTVPLAVANNVLASTTNGLKCRFSFVDSSSSTSSQVLINQSLDLYVPGGDPTGGTSTVYYQGTYRIIQGLT